MSEPIDILPSESVATSGNSEGGKHVSGVSPGQATSTVSVPSSEVQAAACACPSAPPGAVPQFVYALGQIGYDFVSEARADSIAQKVAAAAGVPPARPVAYDTERLLAYLDANPWDAAAVTWTLSLDATPIYALQPAGSFAGDAYQRLRQFLRERVTEGTERISVGGVMAGAVTLLNGQTVPVVVPEIRTMYSWTTAALVTAVAGPAPRDRGRERAAHDLKKLAIHKFLDRVYYGLRNLGVTSQERALNCAATNAFQIERAYEDALKEEMELDTVQVTRSPICRPSSDCWDVELYFFYHKQQVQTVRKVCRFTVDVSDVAPVAIGPMRSWFTR